MHINVTCSNCNWFQDIRFIFLSNSNQTDLLLPTLYLCLLLGFGAEVAGVLVCTILEPPTAALGDFNLPYICAFS